MNQGAHINRSLHSHLAYVTMWPYAISINQVMLSMSPLVFLYTFRVHVAIDFCPMYLHYTWNIVFSCHHFYLSCSLLLIVNHPCSVTTTKWESNIINHPLSKMSGITNLQCCNCIHLLSAFPCIAFMTHFITSMLWMHNIPKFVIIISIW